MYYKLSNATYYTTTDVSERLLIHEANDADDIKNKQQNKADTTMNRIEDFKYAPITEDTELFQCDC